MMQNDATEALTMESATNPTWDNTQESIQYITLDMARNALYYNMYPQIHGTTRIAIRSLIGQR